MHPRHQLLERKGLDQVVVGARGQALHPGGHLGGGGQHQHPHVRPGRHHRPAHVVAVHHRQVAVQHQHVVVVDAQPLQRGVSASSRADLTAALERLGADLLTVAAGDDVFGEEPSLPAESIPMIGRRPAQPYRLSS